MTLMRGVWCSLVEEWGPSPCAIPLDADKAGIWESDGVGFILPQPILGSYE